MTTEETLRENLHERPLPPGWRWVRLGEVCSRIDYGYTASADPTIESPKFLRITDIQNSSVKWESVPGCRIELGSVEDYLLDDGDIVFARTGATTGKSYLMSHPPIAIFASYLIRVRVAKKITPEFLFAFFQSDGYWQEISKGMRGGAQGGFNATMLAKLKIPLPPLAEQKRIAAVLREQMAAVEKARAAAEARLEAVKALPAAFLRQVFPQPGQPFPQGWRWVRLGDVCYEDRQIVEAHSLEAKNLAYLSLEHVEANTGKILRKPDGLIEDEGLSTTFRFTPEHVLYGKLRPYLNKVALPDINGRCTTEMIPLRSNGLITKEFLAIVLRRQETVEYAMQGKTGSRMPRADMNHLLELEIPLPPLPEQRHLAAVLREQMAAVEKARTAAQAELEAINALPAALLRRAFNGEI